MDPNVCREHLAVLLTDEINTLAQLEELLKREHEVLGSRDVAALVTNSIRPLGSATNVSIGSTPR